MNLIETGKFTIVVDKILYTERRESILDIYFAQGVFITLLREDAKEFLQKFKAHQQLSFGVLQEQNKDVTSLSR